MDAPQLSILVIEDDEGDRKLLRRSLGDSGLDFRLSEAGSFGAAVTSHAGTSFDFILIDNGLPDGAGLDLIEEVGKTWPQAGVALMTGLGSEDLAAGAIKKGAVDYIPKRRINGPLMAQAIGNGVKVARLRAKIASQNQALERFARTLAHDLRSPLHAVRILAEALLEGVALDSREEIRESAELMVRYSDRLTSLITSLEQYNKLEHTFSLQAAQADTLLDSAIENLGVEIAESGARIERSPLPAIRCHPPEIIRLFQNLISNAIKYRSGEPPIIRIWASTGEVAGLCTIRVADNGIGIPDDKHETVFEEFRRLHPRGEVAGTGLGLSMCRRIVERHGGRIRCEPVDGKGTVFAVQLPVVAGPDQRLWPDPTAQVGERVE